jgi:hypothetical protein
MTNQGMTHQTLCDSLSALAPCELLGMALLRQGPPVLFPGSVPREQLREAVIEIIAYTNRCQLAAQRLETLSAVPLRTVVIGEFGL